jgi:hypothetical protein
MISLLAAVATSFLFYYLGKFLSSDNSIIAVGLAILFGILTWQGIDKIVPKRRKDDSELFPYLRKDALEKWGAKFAEQHKHIKKIVLYDAPMRYPIDSKYILYFDFDTTTPEGEKEEEVFNETNAFKINTILNSEFKKVYRNEPGSRFRDEWFLSIVKYSGFDDKYSWLIHQDKKETHSTGNNTISQESNVST